MVLGHIDAVVASSRIAVGTRSVIALKAEPKLARVLQQTCGMDVLQCTFASGSYDNQQN